MKKTLGHALGNLTLKLAEEIFEAVCGCSLTTQKDIYDRSKMYVEWYETSGAAEAYRKRFGTKIEDVKDGNDT